MIHKHKMPRILFPKTVNEALEIIETETDAVFWAGGTMLADPAGRNDTVDLPRVVVALSRVEELARASRSDQGLEIGSMMTLDRLAAIGRSTLPPTMPETIAGIANRPIRCRATLGGHLVVNKPMGDLRPLLQLLDSRVEVRYLRERRGRGKSVLTSRKIPIGGLDDPYDGLHRGVLLTRVSIPTGRWNFGQYKKIRPDADDYHAMFFYALARIEKNILSEFRMAFTDGFCGILRDREMETSVAGRQLPLSRRETDAVLESVDLMTAPWDNHAFEKETALNLTRGFLSRAVA